MCCLDIVFEGIRDVRKVIDLYGVGLLCELGLNCLLGYLGKDKRKRGVKGRGILFFFSVRISLIRN